LNLEPGTLNASPLQTPLRFLSGVGPKRAEQLAKFGLETVEDLLYHLPFRYEDRRQIKKITEATVGEEQSFIGQLAGLQKRYNPRRRSQIVTATLKDDTGFIGLLWYRAPSFLVDKLIVGNTFLIHGKVERGLGGQFRLVHPDFELLDSADDAQLQRIVPIYLRPGGLPLSLIRKWIGHAMEQYSRYLPDELPGAVVAR